MPYTNNDYTDRAAKYYVEGKNLETLSPPPGPDGENSTLNNFSDVLEAAIIVTAIPTSSVLTSKKASMVNVKETESCTNNHSKVRAGSIYASETEVEISRIVLDKNNETYRHHPSGIRYDPKENIFFTRVSTHPMFTRVSTSPSDFRAISYDVTNGVFKPTTLDRNGELNRKVLKDQDWDRKSIYNKKYEKFYSRLYGFL